MTVMEPVFLDRETVDQITIIGLRLILAEVRGKKGLHVDDTSANRLRRAAVDVLLEYLGESA